MDMHESCTTTAVFAQLGRVSFVRCNVMKHISPFRKNDHAIFSVLDLHPGVLLAV